MALLTQNSELKPDGIWNWTLPAWQVKLSDGTWFNACPQACACVNLCYARNGTYLFPTVKAKHLDNLERTLSDLGQWQSDMLKDIKSHKKITYVRIHDAGDFYSDAYLQSWLDIAILTPAVTFYAYTKEVSRFKRMVEGACPKNLKYLYSLGGKEDHLINKDDDRHAEVFPDEAALDAAGYMNQTTSDLLAITLPTNKIGIEANNIKHFKKKQGFETFGSLQAARDNNKTRKPRGNPGR